MSKRFSTGRYSGIIMYIVIDRDAGADIFGVDCMVDVLVE